MKAFKRSVFNKKSKQPPPPPQQPQHQPPYPTDNNSNNNNDYITFPTSDVSNSIDFIKQVHEREFPMAQSRRRQTENDYFTLNQAQISAPVTPDIQQTAVKKGPPLNNNSDIVPPMSDPLQASTIQRQTQINGYIVSTIDKLNIGPVGEFLKTILIALTNRLLSSQYINSSPSSQIHLQSFLYGVVTTSLVLFISPFLSVYLDSWVVLLVRLFKHIIGWLVGGFALHYVIRSKQSGTTGTSASTPQQYYTQPPPHKYQQLQYSVKNTNGQKVSRKLVKIQEPDNLTNPSTPPPPRSQNRPRPLPRSPEKQQQLQLHSDEIVDTTHGVRRSDDTLSKRPISNYDKFINAAYEKERRDMEYERFVRDTAEADEGDYTDEDYSEVNRMI
ncbi:hypothetical protein WICPIJ_000550 [Wickerhamomyces pijperi]|uniref:Uncharacterized protein n=1 Tax=Wickerhamomyces pijperi TaxID=599730 RepID=A0A9P8TRJ3_WICPI|nr:hypothetical protein WICPIJ_000550 [Wickerhamomyces pijperi]